MAIDLRTEHQKMRDKRADKVCELYQKLKEDNAGSDTQIMTHIAEEVSKKFKKSLSLMGVRYILKNRGLYEPATR